MIIEEDKDMDLGLALSDPNRRVDTKLSTSLGSDAKANARSRIDMAFVASDSPSELVWCRDKGLRLKRTKCNLSEKPSCLQNVRPKKLLMLPTRSIRSRGTNDDNPTSDRNLPAPEDEFHEENAAATGGGAEFANTCHSQVPAEDSSNRKRQRKENDSISHLSKQKLVSDTSTRRREVDVKENKIPPMLHPSSKQVPDASNIFEVIRGLRLSRKDVLKWMSSPMSVSCLDGFFLRIRLRNWEEGVGRTGYNVACIIETQSEKTSEGSKNSIYINVGATKCLVESQYVSNHDFTEDELMGWWETTSTRKKILSNAYLKSKVEEWKSL